MLLLGSQVEVVLLEDWISGLQHFRNVIVLLQVD